jgi:hypothetical protein
VSFIPLILFLALALHPALAGSAALALVAWFFGAALSGTEAGAAQALMQVSVMFGAIVTAALIVGSVLDRIMIDRSNITVWRRCLPVFIVAGLLIHNSAFSVFLFSSDQSFLDLTDMLTLIAATISAAALTVGVVVLLALVVELPARWLIRGDGVTHNELFSSARALAITAAVFLVAEGSFEMVLRGLAGG